MTTENFIDIHKGDSLTEKLQLLVRQHGIICMDAVNYNNAAHNHNVDDMAYWIRERCHIEDRCEWLYGCLSEALAERELEAQEPRLLRLCDVKALERDTDIWLEVKLLDGSTHVRACTVRNITPERLIIHGCIRDYDFMRYGITWNCWTSRPTDAQREATPWDRV